MKPSLIKAGLKSLIKARLNTYVWGPPGVGKSQIVKQVADELGLEMIDVRATLLDPVDLRGIPTVIDKVTHWCPPCFLPRKEKCLLFLDELAQAPQLVQSACLQLVLDRKIGEYTLPEDCVIVAASNRSSDRAGAHRVITPLLNRFVHMDFDVHVDDWIDWASKNDIDTSIQWFVKFKPTQLNNFEQCKDDKAFATPRSWSFVNSIIKSSKESISELSQLLEGAIGKASTEYIAFVRLKDKLPDIDYIMAEPESAPVPVDEAGVLYALCGALEEKLKDKANYESYFKYIMRIPPEFSVMSYKQCATKFPEIKSHPLKMEWWKKNKQYLSQ